jgi:peroxiredoxin
MTIIYAKEKIMLKRCRSAITAATLSSVMMLSSALVMPTANAIEPQRGNAFSMRSLEGQRVSNESVQGKVIVLAFGASWLPLSKTQLQGLRQLAEDYANRGVTVYWVSTDSESAKSRNYASDEQLRAFANKHGINVTVLRDPEGTASKAFGVDQLPAVVILDRSGNVAGSPIGGLDPNKSFADQVAPRLNQVLAGS